MACGWIQFTEKHYQPRGKDEPVTQYAKIVRCVALAGGRNYSAGAIRVELENQKGRDDV
jgi:hypothetical protein